MPRRVAIAAAVAAAALTLCACSAVSRGLDRVSLRVMARIAARGPKDPVSRPLPFSSAAELERLTRPAGPPQVAVGQQRRHRLDDVRLVQEEITFPSAVALRHPESNRAVAHVWRRCSWGGRPVLLWLPGQGTSAKDWPSLERYFTDVLEAGADVVMLVPPYHLERTPAGMGSGEAFLATDFADHLRAFVQELSDLRALALWLRSQGVQTLGAFGSSMGGGAILRVATWEEAFDFVVVKQPLVSWEAVMARPEVEGVRSHIEAQGVTAEEVRAAYRALDVRLDRPRVGAGLIWLLHGRYDLIAPRSEAQKLVDAWSLFHVTTYPRGHSLITLGGATYRDVPRIVSQALASLRILRGG